MSRHFLVPAERFRRPRHKIGFRWWKEFEQSEWKKNWGQRTVLRWHLRYEPFYSGMQVHKFLSIRAENFDPVTAAAQLKKLRQEFREAVNQCKAEQGQAE